MLELTTTMLVSCLAASLVLTVLVALAVLARTGLRGRRWLLICGFGLGLVCGAVELGLPRQLPPLTLLVDGWPYAVWLEIGLHALFAGLTYFVIVGILLRAVMQLSRPTARRRGDVVALAAGLGCGLALSATALRLGLIGVWPPSALFVAVVYPPVQLCFALLLAAGVLATRAGAHMASRFWKLAAAVLQTGYQFVLRTNDTIGHWLAWLEPESIGWLWLGLIGLAWALGLAVMVGLGRAEPPEAHIETASPGGLLSARFWLWAGIVVLAPTGALLALGLSADLGVLTARVMLLALFATPLMAAAILLRTALSLQRRPTEPSAVPR
ncbi:MAG: hypothetical protein R3D28_25470 [Geminicoccaceae bacterium]|jgi:hypothetical protein|nr:hypothetical protein [Geminicoccaceae bacterium]